MPWGRVEVVSRESGNSGSATWSTVTLLGRLAARLRYNGDRIVSEPLARLAGLRLVPRPARAATAAPPAMTEPAPPVPSHAAVAEPDGFGPDQELVSRVLAGEESLFSALVRRYQTRVVAHVARMVGSREDALDLAQEIFLKVYQALDRYNPEFKFSTWLFRIAGNAAIDHH